MELILLSHHPSPEPTASIAEVCSRIALVCFLDESAPVWNPEGRVVDPALQGSPADVQIAKRDGRPDISGLHLLW